MKKLKYLLLLLLIFNFAACNYEIEEIKRNVRLEEISVVLTEEAQRTYYEGQKFTDKGIEVWEHYSDGTVQKGDLSYAKIDDDALYAALDKKEDSAEIKVNYYGLTTSFTVNVGENAPQELVILNYPYKMIYNQDQTEFESAGLEVGIKWRNGSISKLADEDFTATLTGKNVFVSINDKSKSVEFEIRRNKISVTDINIEDYPNRLTYRVGDKIDFTGLQYSAINKKESKDDKFQTVATFQEDSVNISSKVIPNDWDQPTYPVTIRINDKKVDFYLNIVGNYFDHAYLANEKRVYLGEEKNFKDFNFKEVETNGDEIGILDNDKSNLKYSVNTNVGFNSANAINVPYTFNAEGLCTVYFYYKYKINKDVNESYTPTYTWSEQFQVLPPVLEKITAAFTYNSGISSIPLESSPDVEFEKNYGAWTITGSYTDSAINTEHSLTIEPNECVFSIESDGHLDVLVYRENQTVPVSITYTDKIYNKSYTASVNITYTKPILRNIEVPDSKIKLQEYETNKYLILESQNFTAVYSNGKTEFTEFEFKNSTPTVGLNYYEIKEVKEVEEVGKEEYIKVLLDIESVQEYQAEPTEQTGTGTQPQGE